MNKFAFLAFMVVIAVVAAMSYDFAQHNTRYAIFMACAKDGYANVRFGTIECTPLHPDDAPRVMDRLLPEKENAPANRGVEQQSLRM